MKISIDSLNDLTFPLTQKLGVSEQNGFHIRILLRKIHGVKKSFLDTIKGTESILKKKIIGPRALKFGTEMLKVILRLFYSWDLFLIFCTVHSF